MTAVWRQSPIETCHFPWPALLAFSSFPPTTYHFMQCVEIVYNSVLKLHRDLF